MTERKVSYFYDADIGNYHYGQGTIVENITPALKWKGELVVPPS